GYLTPPGLPPFPTRRSSDLEPRHEIELGRGVAQRANGVADIADLLGQRDRVPHRRPAGLVVVRARRVGDRDRLRRIEDRDILEQDRKSTRLNSSHVSISYAV